MAPFPLATPTPHSWRPAVSTLGRPPLTSRRPPLTSSRCARLEGPGPPRWCGLGRGGAGQKRGGRTGRAGRPFARTHSSLSRTTSVLSLSWQGGCEARHGRGGRGGVWSPWLPCGEDPQGGPRARLAGKGAVAAGDSRRPLPCQSRQQGLQSDPTSVFTPSSTP